MNRFLSTKKRAPWLNSFLFFMIFTVLMCNVGWGNVIITQPSNGTTICSYTAVGGGAPAFTTLNNIVITESATNDFPKNKTSATITITAPAGWQFKTGVGTASKNSADFTNLTIAVTPATITLTWSTPNGGGDDQTDIITISGIQVQATSTLSAAGPVYCSALSQAVGGITAGVQGVGTSFADLALITAPVITADPTNQTIATGTSTSFSVAASNSPTGYTWQVSTDGGASWSNVSNGGVYSGATTATLIITAAPIGMNGYKYKASATNACGTSSYSTVATLTVADAYLISAGGTSTTCSGSFYDSGGSGGPYANSENFTKTFAPVSSSDRLKVHFNSFNIENAYDYLYVYNGPNTGSPQVAGSPFTGATLPADITSTAANGELTFRFTSDVSGWMSGWEAVLSCVAAPVCSGTPAPGNTFSTDNPVVSGANFTLSIQNAIAGTGVTYLWQSSTLGTFTGASGDVLTNLGTTSTQVTLQTTALYYRCLVTCSGNTGISTPILINMNTAGSCTSSSYSLIYATSNQFEDITNVTVGTLNNTSSCGDVAGGTGSISARYSNYAGTVAAPSLEVGEPIPFSLSTACAGATDKSGFQIYIDFNQNGVFDNTEQMYNSPSSIVGSHTETGSFTIPSSALLGTTRMRIVNRETTTTPFPYPTNLAETTYGWGETEDYCVNLTATPMVYTSSTVTQASVANISLCSANQPVICIQVVTTGSLSPLVLTNISIINSGSVALTGLDKIHVYYTGNSNLFIPMNALDGAGTTPAGGTLSINGSQTLMPGTNYFWVAYDMNTTAVVGTTVDTKLLATGGITISGVAQTASVVDPAGSRTVAACLPAPGGVDNGLLTVWYKADNGITLTAGKISQWATSGGSATGYNLTQATAASQPTVTAGSTNYKEFNYNKRVNFILANNTYLENLNNTPELLGITGTFFATMTKATTNGTAICFRSSSNYSYQFKPSFRVQSGTTMATGSSIDIYDPTNTNYPNYFTGEWPGSAAFLIQASGLNTNLKTRVNSRSCNVLTNTNSSTYNPSIGQGLSLGRNSGGGEYVENDISEIIMYSAILTTFETDKVESYLAIKYGITRGGNSGTSTIYNYIASNGITVFDKASNSGYTNDIAGIGRDDASALNQKQSISVNVGEIATIGLGTIASENATNVNTFASDRSFLIWGNNGLPTYATAATQIPAAALPATIESRIHRIWKVQATNFGGNTFKAPCPAVKIGFEVSALVNYTSISNLRLLVDDDGANWSNATVYSGATLNGTRVEFGNVIFAANQMYFTLASIDKAATPLPVELTAFDASCENDRVNLTWTTASETNNDYFLIERSIDAQNWEYVNRIEGGGNSNALLHYSYLDLSGAGVKYYRLIQTDFDGATSIYGPISVDCNEVMPEVLYTPNPFNDQIIVNVQNVNSDNALIILRDITGRVVITQHINSEDMQHSIIIDVSHLANGIYNIEFNSGGFIKNKLVVKHI